MKTKWRTVHHRAESLGGFGAVEIQRVQSAGLPSICWERGIKICKNSLNFAKVPPFFPQFIVPSLVDVARRVDDGLGVRYRFALFSDQRKGRSISAVLLHRPWENLPLYFFSFKTIWLRSLVSDFPSFLSLFHCKILGGKVGYSPHKQISVTPHTPNLG